MATKKISGVKHFVENLVSVRLTAVLLFILIPMIVFGSLIPQDRSFAEYARVYGVRLTDFLYASYLISIFRSPWFLILVAILGVNVAGCFLKSLLEKKRSFGFYLVHISLILLMVGGMVSALGRVRGEIKLREGESASALSTEDGKIPLGFELRLKDFELQKYDPQGEKLIVRSEGLKEPLTFAFRRKIWTAIPGTPFEFQVERYLPDFRYDMSTGDAFSASEEAENPAVLVHVRGKDTDYSEWVFARFENFHKKDDRPLELQYVWAPVIPKAFISRVEILENGKVTEEKAIAVNRPLRYKGFSIYQASYDSEGEAWSGFEVVKDPGTWMVYASVILIMLGLVINIYVRPLLKKEPAGSKIKEF